MFGSVRAYVGGALIAAAFGAGSIGVEAATITSGSLLETGITLDLDGVTPCGATGSLSTNVGTFSGTGPAGSGTASCGDKRSPQVKTDTTPHAYGRYDPEGTSWVDLNDLAYVTWNVDIGEKVRGLSFALTDAHDQADSHFRIEAEGAVWEILEREPNGSLHLITILFDEAVRTAEINFSTRHNDGYGVSEATVQPVPLPPALLLSATGIALIAGLRRRRSRAG